jgi:hypothetical protein
MGRRHAGTHLHAAAEAGRLTPQYCPKNGS